MYNQMYNQMYNNIQPEFDMHNIQKELDIIYEETENLCYYSVILIRDYDLLQITCGIYSNLNKAQEALIRIYQYNVMCNSPSCYFIHKIEHIRYNPYLKVIYDVTQNTSHEITSHEINVDSWLASA